VKRIEPKEEEKTKWHSILSMDFTLRTLLYAFLIINLSWVFALWTYLSNPD